MTSIYNAHIHCWRAFCATFNSLYAERKRGRIPPPGQTEHTVVAGLELHYKKCYIWGVNNVNQERPQATSRSHREPVRPGPHTLLYPQRPGKRTESTKAKHEDIIHTEGEETRR